MPYYKSKYKNGAIVPMKWTEKAIMPSKWYNQINKPITETIQAIKPATTTAGFTGFKYTYAPPVNQNKNTDIPAHISNSSDPYEINSMTDILFSSFNPNMKHHYDKIAKVRNVLHLGKSLTDPEYKTDRYWKLKHKFKAATLEYAARVIGNTWGHMQQHYFYEGAGEDWTGLIGEGGKDIAKNAPLALIPAAGVPLAALKTLFWDLPQGKSAPLFTNIMTDVGEVMDILTAPIRATAQTIADPLFENTGVNISDEVPTSSNMLGNIGKALVQSTIGDEGGRKNFDWEIDTPMADAGDFALNFGLEIIFDADNISHMATKGAVKNTLDFDPTAFQKQADEFYNSLTEVDKAEVLNLMKRKNLIASEKNTEQAIKQTYITSLVQHIKQNYVGGSNSDTLNNLNKVLHQSELFEDIATTNLRN